MARQAERKQETRKKMLEAASRCFREHGFAGVGIDAIAKAADATSGAFYAHLGSKNGAFDAALELGLGEVIDAIPRFQHEGGEDWPRLFVDYYLGDAHRADLAGGCAMTSMTPEVVRASEATHAIYEHYMNRIVDLIADGLAGDSVAIRRAKAWAFLSILTGGLAATRGVRTKKAAMEIADAVRQAAIAVSA